VRAGGRRAWGLASAPCEGNNRTMSGRDSIRSGVTLSSLAALLFGLTAPLVQRAAEGAGALSSAALLYLGAAIAAGAGLVARRRGDREAPLRRPQIGALLAVALFGGMVAPVLLVLGLRSTDSASAALLLALEAPFTLGLARMFYGERIGRRVVSAAGLIAAGALIAVGGHPGGRTSIVGGVLVVAAALAWAIDNALSRRLADRDPLAVVTGKGLIGGGAAALAGLALDQAWPTLLGAGALLTIGAFGFGVSLQLYLRAQRIMGAARTASVFAIAPFVGVGGALLLGAPWPGWTFGVAAVLIAIGVGLHTSERHAHPHLHEETEHEHLHTHDDGHHDHAHDPMPAGPHSHLHRHGGLEHSHPHGEDIHHRGHKH
jgi:drug/metabolite transporter (DMT)-like permease